MKNECFPKGIEQRPEGVVLGFPSLLAESLSLSLVVFAVFFLDQCHRLLSYRLSLSLFVPVQPLHYDHRCLAKLKADYHQPEIKIL